MTLTFKRAIYRRSKISWRGHCMHFHTATLAYFSAINYTQKFYKIDTRNQYYKTPFRVDLLFDWIYSKKFNKISSR